MTLSPAQRLLVREAARAELAVRSLRDFVKFAWSIIEPRRPLVWSWHMDAICDHLEASYRHEDPKECLVINIPPRHSKSSLVSVLGPAWWWLHHPEAQFLCITRAEKNAARDARHMRRVVTSPWYRRIVAMLAAQGRVQDWTMSEDQNRLDYYATSAGGHRISITTNSMVTGAGCDFLIIDDPHDAEEVATGSGEGVLKIMDETEARYDEVWSARRNPGGRTHVVMQRLHESDQAGRRLAEPDKTTALVLPLEYESDHPHRWKGDPRTVDGEILAPDRFDAQWVAALKSSPAKHAGQAQQRPSPRGGGQIKRDWFSERYACLPSDWCTQAEELWVSADAAKKSGADADYHSIQVWARVGARRYLLHDLTERMTYPEFELALDGVVEEWRDHARRGGSAYVGVLVEDTANGTTYLQTHQGRVDGLLPFHPSSDTPGADKSKGARAVYLERAAEAGQIVLPHPSVAPWVEAWLHEITSFPGAAHDDRVDAASQINMRWTTSGAWATIGVT